MFENISGFFNSLGWIGNAITIGGFLLTAGVLSRKHLRRLKTEIFVYKNFASVASFVPCVFGDEAEYVMGMVKALRVAIVDDEPQHFPVDFLRKLVKHVEIYKKISLADVNDLFKYDLILLDIVGVVEEDAKKGGIEILKRINKEAFPRPLVIIVSSKKFSPEVNKFFGLADDILDKPIAPAELEQSIRQLLHDNRSPFGLANQLDSALRKSNLSSTDYQRVTRRLISYLDGTEDNTWLRANVLAKFGISGAAEFESIGGRLQHQIKNAPKKSI